jgi:cytochrome P450
VAERDFPHASVIEGVRFTAQVALPNLIQGLFRRRKQASAIASRTGADGLAVGFLAGVKRSYGEGPVWIRVAKDETLLLLGRTPIRRALEGSPEPFAADPEPKKSAMSHFQPHALTISRDGDWEDRRKFTEAVLDAGMSSLADRFAAVCVEESARLEEELDWDTWNRAVRRVTRRIILGDGAADDDSISEMLGELMDKSNPPGGGDEELYERYVAALQRYVDEAEPGSLVSLFERAPVTERTEPVGQVTHWLFALGDTLAINALRCLALLAAFDEQRERVSEEVANADLNAGSGVDSLKVLEACLQEAMRLWPTTAMLSREAVRDVDWDGITIRAGKQVLIVNNFNHRDDDAVPFADRFDPDAWLSGDAADDWIFNHFSHGPQGCPGTALALFVGKAMLASLLGPGSEVRLLSPRLDPTKPLPHTLDFFGLKLSLGGSSAG